MKRMKGHMRPFTTLLKLAPPPTLITYINSNQAHGLTERLLVTHTLMLIYAIFAGQEAQEKRCQCHADHASLIYVKHAIRSSLFHSCHIILVQAITAISMNLRLQHNSKGFKSILNKEIFTIVEYAKLPRQETQTHV
jgi:hypothetical protein